MQIFISITLLFLMQKNCYYLDKISEIFIKINLKLFVAQYFIAHDFEYIKNNFLIELIHSNKM